jgi:hypothetical protein
MNELYDIMYDMAEGTPKSVDDRFVALFSSKEARIQELIEANNREVERRRHAEQNAREAGEGMRVFMSAYSTAMERLRVAVKPLAAGQNMDPLANILDVVEEQLYRLQGLEK